MTSKTRRTIALIDALAGKTSLYSQPYLVVAHEAFDLLLRSHPAAWWPACRLAGRQSNNRLDRYDCGLLFKLNRAKFSSSATIFPLTSARGLVGS